ncbi:hypothetical protein EV217_1400 [Phyllobacterium myrsinacearum]|uniref:hypothetical protein n=1 Tax=Phyllobacterium myrsinacearum TaxID=28101 RepID=UPI00102A65E6|nr:hypothetical protein [Phyllobacterium myrsinacearum]RZS89003.1 hypothetical protein EV217_1400 [Phyllobacterium myrsinacearum]
MRELTEAELDLVWGGAPGRSGTYDSKDHWGIGGPTGSAKSALDGARIAFSGTLQGSYTLGADKYCIYGTPIGGFDYGPHPIGYECPPTTAAPKTI